MSHVDFLVPWNLRLSFREEAELFCATTPTNSVHSRSEKTDIIRSVLSIIGCKVIQSNFSVQVHRTTFFSTQKQILLEYMWPRALYGHSYIWIIWTFFFTGIRCQKWCFELSLCCLTWNAEQSIQSGTRWLCRDHISFIVTVGILEAILKRIPTIYKLILLLC